MKRSCLRLLAAVAVVWIGLGDAAGQDRKIPLGSVYTTTGQKDAKDATAEFRDEAPPYGMFRGLPAVFLVNGNDFRAAIKASHPFLEARDGKTPAPKAETKAGRPHWVGACLGSDGSVPPAFRLLAVEISGRKIRVTYESIQRDVSTGDRHPYLLWAPLGNLTAGAYALELFDATTKKVTLSRKSKAQVADIEEAPEKPATDQARILGAWVVVNDEGYLGKRWTFDKDRIVMDMDFGLPVGKEKLYHPYHLDPEQKPKHLTFTFKLEGDKLARTLLDLKCIYALDGDELKICLCPDDPDEQRARLRPRAFPKKPGPGQVLVMRRVRPGDDAELRKKE